VTAARCGTKAFTAVDPATGEALPGDYPVSSWLDIEDALRAGAEAAPRVAGAGPEAMAFFFEALAAGLERRVDAAVALSYL